MRCSCSRGKRAAPSCARGATCFKQHPGTWKEGESQAGGIRSTTLKGGEKFPPEIRNVAKSLYYQGFQGFFTGTKTLFFGQGLAGWERGESLERGPGRITQKGGTIFFWEKLCYNKHYENPWNADWYMPDRISMTGSKRKGIKWGDKISGVQVRLDKSCGNMRGFLLISLALYPKHIYAICVLWQLIQ